MDWMELAKFGAVGVGAVGISQGINWYRGVETADSVDAKIKKVDERMKKLGDKILDKAASALEGEKKTELLQSKGDWGDIFTSEKKSD